MPESRILHGEVVQLRGPEWQPLLDVAGPELTGWFMWMFAVELEDGRRVHAYKHILTRSYLHLSTAGEAFAYVPMGGYRPVGLADLLEAALSEWWEQLGATAEQTALCWSAIARAEDAARA